MRTVHRLLPAASLLLFLPSCITGGFGGTEVLVIAGILLLLFGGRKLPELMRGMGSGINEFKKGLKDGEKSDDDDDDGPPKEIPTSGDEK
ncbi:MAG: twin-arginine translocase TatA/TatE family subunit [Planctomycetes bacterium]|nr:twin-arginine translocase TatA/TatE family subunit [Planctomycetota bacterium]